MSDTSHYKGEILGRDVNDSEQAIAITAERDVNGKGLLRVINTNYIIKGIATSGLPGKIVDTTKNLEVDLLKDKLAKVTVDKIDYYRKIASNTATEIILTSPLVSPVAATAIIGTGDGTAEVTITVKINVPSDGADGNKYSVRVVEAPGTDDNLSASLADDIITVYLGKTGGELDGAKNTATNVATVIGQIPEFDAAMTGSGGIIPVTVEDVPFTGGDSGVSVVASTPYEVLSKNDNEEIVPVNTSGTELFTTANPGVTQLSGSNAEKASAQDTQLATVAETYNRAEGASRMEVYCESGYIRVRTDGQPATSTTGEPIAAGFGACWEVDSISVFYVQESIITVVSR